jgi:hypothetical protein
MTAQDIVVAANDHHPTAWYATLLLGQSIGVFALIAYGLIVIMAAAS